MNKKEMKGRNIIKNKREAMQTFVWSSLVHLCLSLAWYLTAVPWCYCSCWHQAVWVWVTSQADCASFVCDLVYFQSQMRQSLETIRHFVKWSPSWIFFQAPKAGHDYINSSLSVLVLDKVQSLWMMLFSFKEKEMTYFLLARACWTSGNI